MQTLPRSHATLRGGFRNLVGSVGSPPPFICPSCRQYARYQLRYQNIQHRARRNFSAGVSSSRISDVSPPPLPPAAGYARLTTRRLISIAGADASRFLQGLIMSSMTYFDSVGIGNGGEATTRPTPQQPRPGGGEKIGFYSGFLNATGRVLHDVFVYRDDRLVGVTPGSSASEPGEGFLVEVDATQIDTLAAHLRRHKLRSKLKLRVLGADECGVWQVWDDGISSETRGGARLGGLLLDSDKGSRGTVLVRQDTRAPDMGYRLLTGASGQQHVYAEVAGRVTELAQGDVVRGEPEESDVGAYDIRRYLRGVPEGQAEMRRAQTLPLEGNMDVMGGIDFRKGCYVGQELTIRTRHRGVVRKRVLPCMLYGEGESVPEKLEYRPGWESATAVFSPAPATREGGGDERDQTAIGRVGKKGRSVGNWLAGTGNIGLALCRLQVMTDVELPGEAATAPFDPSDEFVLFNPQRGTDDHDGQQAQGQALQGKIRVKAFVPGWLRSRLDEDIHPVQ